MSFFQELSFKKFYELHDELEQLLFLEKIKWDENNSDQICLNTIPSEPDDYKLGRKSLFYDWDKMTISKEGMEVPKKENPLAERDFTVLCSQFKGTLFEDFYKTLSEKYVLGRVRIIKSSPSTCYSWHSDETPRVHYVLKTQPGCKMVIENEIIFLPENTWWRTETTFPHTAFNGSQLDRIHIVAVILDEKK